MHISTKRELQSENFELISMLVYTHVTNQELSNKAL